MSKTAVAAKGALLGILILLCTGLLAGFFLSLVSMNRTSSADFSSVSEAVLEASDLSPMLEGDNQMIRRIYGLDPDSYAGALLYYPSGNMGCEELLLIRLADLNQQEQVRTVMEARIASQRSAFDGYAPRQCEILDRAIVEVRGNYLIMIIADEPEPVLTAFLGAL